MLEGPAVSAPSSSLLPIPFTSSKGKGATSPSGAPPPHSPAASSGASSPVDTPKSRSASLPPGQVAAERQPELVLEPGKVYSWDFIFEVPHEAAPYERSKHGKLYQKLSAKLTLRGSGGLMGAGKKTLTSSKNAFFVALPARDGALAYSFTHRDAAEHLGPMLVTTRSQHLTVGGYIRTALSLPSPRPDLIITQSSLTLAQKVTLHSRRRRGHKQACPVEMFPVLLSDGEDVVREETPISPSDEAYDPNARDGDAEKVHVSFEGSWINKLPTDDKVRPSSLPGSDSAIKLSHEFDFVLKYTFPGAKEVTGKDELVYRATWDVALPSCAARYDTVNLPGYSFVDSMPVPEIHRDEFKGANEHESHTHCACGDSLEKLVKVEERAGRLQHHRLADDIRQDMAMMRLTSRSSSRSNSRGPSRSVSRSVSRRPSFERRAGGATAGSSTVATPISEHPLEGRGRSGGATTSPPGNYGSNRASSAPGWNGAYLGGGHHPHLRHTMSPDELSARIEDLEQERRIRDKAKQLYEVVGPDAASKKEGEEDGPQEYMIDGAGGGPAFKLRNPFKQMFGQTSGGAAGTSADAGSADPGPAPEYSQEDGQAP